MKYKCTLTDFVNEVSRAKDRTIKGRERVKQESEGVMEGIFPGRRKKVDGPVDK